MEHSPDPLVQETEQATEQKSAYLILREKRIQDLAKASDNIGYAQYLKDEATSTPALMPENLVRDPLTNSAIQKRAMVESDYIYDIAKKNFGGSLTDLEEEQLLSVLDYSLKRIINVEISKKSAAEPGRNKQDLMNAVSIGMVDVLPGDRDMVANHDLIHIVLAIKQGLFNDNSTVPTFMQTEETFDTSKQAMLEEAFASIYTVSEDGQGYDGHLKNPKLYHEEAESMFRLSGTPLFRGLNVGKSLVFSDEQLYLRAKASITAFIEKNIDKLQAQDPLTDIALFSQGASLYESIHSPTTATLSEEEKVIFIDQQIVDAQLNIDTLISGVIPEGSPVKYAKTIEVTRTTLANALDKAKSAPDQPVFIEELLETFKPLYPKAKAQQDAAFDRILSSKYDLKS